MESLPGCNHHIAHRQVFTPSSDRVAVGCSCAVSHPPIRVERHSFRSSFLLIRQLCLASEAEIRNEFEQWKNACIRIPPQSRPQSPLTALDIVPERYENIRTLLRIFSTLPVTTCFAERAFSAMKLLKTYLRNAMSDERLTGLALMYIHPEIDIDPHTVVDRFASPPVNRTRRAENEKTKRPRLLL